MALNDRLRLRDMAAAEKGELFYVTGEEAAIRAVVPLPDRVFAPRGGQPVIVRLRGVL